MKLFVSLVVLGLSLVNAHDIHIVNNCGFTIWPGILNNPGKELPLKGGFELHAHQTHKFKVPHGWAGRFWGRTHCDAKGHCLTGDCGHKIACHGAGGVPPVSLAEIKFDGDGGQDYYDVSLVDGYNVPMKIHPIAGTYRHVSKSHYDCNVAGCHSDLNAHCPHELAVHHGNKVIACKSACLRFNTDEYCCRGAHNTLKTCRSSHWKINYPAMFKKSCPNAYSYAYDDHSSTFTCHGKPNTGYVVQFC